MSKSKVQITMDSDLLQAVDDYCDKNYINRSLLISQSLIQVINNQKLIDSIQNLSVSFRKAIEIGGIVDDDLKKEIEDFDSLARLLFRQH